MLRVLALLTETATADQILSASACLLAQAGPTAITLLHPLAQSDPDFMRTEEVHTARTDARFAAAQQALAVELAQRADAWRQSGLPSLEIRAGAPEQIVTAAAREADLILLAAPQGDADARALLDLLLLRLAKPVLLLPRQMPHSFAQSIAIAWSDADNAAARAIGAVQALLRACQRATILLGTDSPHAAPPPQALLDSLEAAGRPARLHEFALAGRHVGTALLAEAHAVGADFLVMGAFTHGRLREILFGGATAEVLRQLDLPVLMQH